MYLKYIIYFLRKCFFHLTLYFFVVIILLAHLDVPAFSLFTLILYFSPLWGKRLRVGIYVFVACSHYCFLIFWNLEWKIWILHVLTAFEVLLFQGRTYTHSNFCIYIHNYVYIHRKVWTYTDTYNSNPTPLSSYKSSPFPYL